jgi:hypothetical protein
MVDVSSRQTVKLFDGTLGDVAVRAPPERFFRQGQVNPGSRSIRRTAKPRSVQGSGALLSLGRKPVHQ